MSLLSIFTVLGGVAVGISFAKVLLIVQGRLDKKESMEKAKRKAYETARVHHKQPVNSSPGLSRASSVSTPGIRASSSRVKNSEDHSLQNSVTLSDVYSISSDYSCNHSSSRGHSDYGSSSSSDCDSSCSSSD